MPRFFFHMMDGGLDPDVEGTELPGPEVAKREAIIYLGQTIRDRPKLVSEDGELRVQVTSDNGTILITIVVQAIETPDLAAVVRERGR